MRKFILLIFAALFCLSGFCQSSNGTLSLNVKTNPTDKKFSPRNIVAVWITTKENKWVKTLYISNSKYKRHLKTFNNQTANNTNTLDATTGATNAEHKLKEYKWNGKNNNGVVVNDGVYKIWIEFTEENNQGPVKSVEFEKSAKPFTLDLKNDLNFPQFKLTWKPEK